MAVGLEDQVQFLDLARLHFQEDILKADELGRRRGRTVRSLPGFDIGARRIVVCHHLEGVAGRRRRAEAHDAGRHTGRRRVHRIAAIVEHGAYAASDAAGDNRVAHVHRARLHEQRGDRAAAWIVFALDHGPNRAAVGGAHGRVDVGHQQDVLQQIIDAALHLGRNRHTDHIAAPFFDEQASVSQFLFDAIRVGVRLVHLVHRDHDRHLGRLGVADRFLGLGHHAVIGRDDQDHDVRHLRAARAHRGKCLVAGRVQEGDSATVQLNLVRANALGDAAGFAFHDVGLANRIQERGLTMIHMPQHGHHGWSFDELFIIL